MISIIIPAKDEEKYLENTLDSLNSQPFQNFETIVVCNGCVDKTIDIAKKNATKVLALKQSNASAARNAGAKIAKGSLLVFLDADTFLKENSLPHIKQTIEEGYSVGTCKAHPDNKKMIAKIFRSIKNMLWRFNSSNGVIFCTKDVFERCQGFDETKTKREDSDLIRRAKKFGKYGMAKTAVVTSMRRYEKKGYLHPVIFWIREGIKPTKRPYEVVR